MGAGLAQKGVVMNIGKVLLDVGEAVVSTMVPGGPAIIKLVNSFLPEDKKLPETATGTQVSSAIATLPPDQQAAVMLKELDVEIEDIRGNVSIVQSMNEADGPGNSTRPMIADRMAWAICGGVWVFILAIAWAIVTKDAATISALNPAWMLMALVLGVPSTVVLRYFNARTDEKKARYAVMAGQEAPASGLANIIKAFTGN